MTDEVIEFSTAGCKTLADDTLRIQIDIDPRYAQRAFRLFGPRGVPGAIVRLKEGHAAVEQKPAEDFGGFWRDLFKQGFFRWTEVLRAIGDEADFENWVRRQPSCLDGAFDTVMDQLSMSYKQRCQCCHVRRVSEGAGTGQKPPYFAVPMTATQHRLQHDQGESAALERYAKGAGPAKEWFAKQADKYRSEWASKALAEQLQPGAKSRAEVDPELVLRWAEKHSLTQFIPPEWRNQ